MPTYIVELTDEEDSNLNWAKDIYNAETESNKTDEEYLAFVLGRACESYGKQRQGK